MPNFFDQIMADYNRPPDIAPGQFTSPYNPMTLPQTFQAPGPAMGPQQPDYSGTSIPELQFQALSAPTPQVEPTKPAPTPWFAKALGGLQDALAVISHAKNPNSQAQFGGIARAMFASRDAANFETLRRQRAAETKASKDADMGRAIILRRISEQIADAKSPGEQAYEDLKKMRDENVISSSEFVQAARDLALGKIAGKKAPATGKGFSAAIVAQQNAVEEATDPEDRAAKQAVLDRLLALEQDRLKGTTAIKTAGQIRVKSTPSPAQAPKPGEISAGEQRTMEAETERLKKDADAAQKSYTKLADRLAQLKGFGVKESEMKDLAAQVKAKKDELDAANKQITDIQERHLAGKAAPAASSSGGWAIVR